MKQIVVTVLLSFFFTSPTIDVAGQERAGEEKSLHNEQIEVRTDRFSNVTTVTLKPQVILDTPDYYLTMKIETKLGEKKFSDFEKESIEAFARLEFQSKAPTDLGDKELHYIIDGVQLNLGEVKIKVNTFVARQGNLKPGFKISESGVKLLNRNALELFSKAKRVEMRLGSLEPALSDPFITNLREYAIQVLAQHKAKEGKP